MVIETDIDEECEEYVETEKDTALLTIRMTQFRIDRIRTIIDLHKREIQHIGESNHRQIVDALDLGLLTVKEAFDLWVTSDTGAKYHPDLYRTEPVDIVPFFAKRNLHIGAELDLKEMDYDDFVDFLKGKPLNDIESTMKFIVRNNIDSFSFSW